MSILTKNLTQMVFIHTIMSANKHLTIERELIGILKENSDIY